MNRCDLPRAAIAPKVSIVTVCYNSEATVRDTVESVLAQDYPNIEYIVIDGASTDATMQILEEYRDRIDVLISEPDNGIYDAMNKGILASSGEFVGMINSDDFYSDSVVISDLMRAVRTSGADAVFADLVYVDPSDLTKTKRYYNSKRWKPAKFRFGWMPAHPTFFIRREWYLRCGLYSLDYRIAADFEMLVRLLYKGAATYTYVNRPVVKMRLGGVSTRSLRHRWILNREIVRACRVNGIWTTLPLVLLKLPAKLLELIVTQRAS
jgi:glycosyltransferase involved in cell wall biosynthesis